ncbi:MAG: ATP-binding protein, partial [Caldilineaceae bacterium]
VLVGRDSEFEQLRTVSEAALAGRGALLFLEGEAGVGKTRLAFSALQHASDAGATVISAGCQAIETNLPFSPLAESLGRYLHRVPNEALHLLPYASLAQMAQIVPSLYDRIPGLPQPPPEPTATADENRQRLIDGIVSFLATLARLRPLALFLDDLHWADADTLAVISRLAQRLADFPIFLLLAYRSDDLAENEALATLLHALRRRGAGRVLEVTRFDSTQVQQYVDVLIGRDNAFNGELASLLFETTQGNPLFVTETLRDLLERHPSLGSEADSAPPLAPAGVDSAPVAPATPLLASALPARSFSRDVRNLLTSRRTQRVHDLILERIERLPDRALWVLQLSAVIARDYSLELLETAATEDPLEGLETLLQRKFLIERPDQRLDFSHQTVRQVAYESMSALQRRRWHLRVADALVKNHRAEHNPAETAFHYGQAGQAAKTPFARYSIAAGEQLLGAYAFRHAIDYFDRALATLADLPDTPPALNERALLGRSLAYESLFDLDGVTEAYRDLLTWARKRSDRALLLKTHSRMATVLGLMGQDRESNRLLQELIGVVGQTVGQPAEEQPAGEAARSHVLADLLYRRATIYSAEGGLSVPLANDGSDPRRPGDDWAPYSAPPPVVSDPVADVLQVLEPVHAVLPLLDYGWTLLVQGQLGEATACLSAVVDLASETAQPSIASTALHQLAVTARILGDMEQSQLLNDQSVAINRRVPGTPSELASMWPRIASALLSLQAGRVDEAERRLRRVLDFLGPRDTYRNYRNSANIGLGLVALARGDLGPARTLLNEALVDPVNLYPYMHVRALLGLARIARLEGDAEAADALLRRTLRFAGRRSLLDEYIETVVEIAAQRPQGAPTLRLIDEILAFVRPVGLEAAVQRLETARASLAETPALATVA